MSSKNIISKKVKKDINIELSENISVKYIASRYSVSSSTVLRVLRTNTFNVNKKWLPELLGIDEFKSIKSVDSNMSVVLCNVMNGDIIDIFTDRRKRYLREYFMSFSEDARNSVIYNNRYVYSIYTVGQRSLPKCSSCNRQISYSSANDSLYAEIKNK